MLFSLGILCVVLAGGGRPTITLDLDETALPPGLFKITTKMAGVACSGVLGGSKLASHPSCRLAEDRTHTEKFTVKCSAGAEADKCKMPVAKAWDHHDGRYKNRYADLHDNSLLDRVI